MAGVHDCWKHFPEGAKSVGEGKGPRMESWGTGATEDGQRRSPQTVLRRLRPTDWKKTRGACFVGGQGTGWFQEKLIVSYAEDGLKEKVSVSWVGKGTRRKPTSRGCYGHYKSSRGLRWERQGRSWVEEKYISVLRIQIFPMQIGNYDPNTGFGILHF